MMVVEKTGTMVIIMVMGSVSLVKVMEVMIVMMMEAVMEAT